MIKIYNTRSRQKEDFVPLDPDGHRVGLYYCGPTVYDSLHLGHTRAFIVPDMVRRYLEYRGYVVRYVANFTDVDDKIIKRALREDRDWRQLTVVYMEEYQRLMSAVGNRPADVHPRATDHIPEMIELIEMLIERGNAYVAADGDLYFDTASFADYGALSGRRLEDQEAGISGRLSDEQLAVKKNSGDFILWKLATNDPQEFIDGGDKVPGWPSPWGKGRPGWHLECSALSRRYLGMPFDIHGGGRDLMFPHHENERAQNDCAFCDQLGDTGTSVRYWIHNGFITLKARDDKELSDEHTEGDDSKMSKSLGNVFWLPETIWPDGPYDPMAVRMLMLSSHYRSPLQYNPELLDQAAGRMDKIYSIIERLTDSAGEANSGAPSGDAKSAAEQATAKFEQSMDDDFNSAGALGAIFELISYAGRELADGDDQASRRYVRRALERLLHTLGLRTDRPTSPASDDAETVDGLVELIGDLRTAARERKDWAAADQIRDGLKALGFEVRDRPGGGVDIVRGS